MVTVYHIRGAKSKPFLPRSASFLILRYCIAERLRGKQQKDQPKELNTACPLRRIALGRRVRAFPHKKAGHPVFRMPCPSYCAFNRSLYFDCPNTSLSLFARCAPRSASAAPHDNGCRQAGNRHQEQHARYSQIRFVTGLYSIALFRLWRRGRLGCRCRCSSRCRLGRRCRLCGRRRLCLLISRVVKGRLCRNAGFQRSGISGHRRGVAVLIRFFLRHGITDTGRQSCRRSRLAVTQCKLRRAIDKLHIAVRSVYRIVGQRHGEMERAVRFAVGTGNRFQNAQAGKRVVLTRVDKRRSSRRSGRDFPGLSGAC